MTLARYPECARYPDLAGRVAVVTGDSPGTAATCRYLAANRVRLALVGPDKDALEELHEQVWDHGGEAVVVPVGDPGALAELPALVAGQLGAAELVLTSVAGYPLVRPLVRQPVGVVVVLGHGAGPVLAELAGTGVRVNALAESGRWERVPPEERDHRVAATAVFLASTASAGLSGVTLELRDSD